MSHDAVARVRAFMEDEGMLSGQGRVICALSGGADSMAMTHILSRILGEERLLCAHVNHGIRGEEADGDEKFVWEWCRDMGLALEVLRADVPKEAKKAGEGLEECGRRLRYGFLRELSQKKGGLIATAHTQSDQAETVLLHLIQGAGARGLSGIWPVRGDIIRPVLCLSREETVSYCRENGIPWREDSTNRCLDYTRNRLRHQVLPLLREMNPNMEEALVRTAGSLREDEICLDKTAGELVEKARLPGNKGLSVPVLQKADQAVLIRALRRCLEEKGCLRPEAVHIRQAAALVRQAGGRMDLPGGFFLEVWRDRLCVSQKTSPQAAWETPVLHEKTILGDGRILFREVCPVSEIKNRIKFHNLLFPILLDYDTISHSRGNLTVRTRRGGDRFSPAGRGVSKTLKKLFSEERVPAVKRDCLAVLELDGEILWVEGFGVCERCRPGKNTQTVLLLWLLEADGREAGQV